MLSRTLSRIPRTLFSKSIIRSGSHYVRYNYNPLVECESQNTKRKFSNTSHIEYNKNGLQYTEDDEIQRLKAKIFISAKVFSILGLFAIFGFPDKEELHEDFT